MNTLHDFIRKIAFAILAADLAHTIAILWRKAEGNEEIFKQNLKPFLEPRLPLSKTEHAALNKAIIKATQETYELEDFVSSKKKYNLKPSKGQRNFVMLLRNIRESWEKAGKNADKFEQNLRTHFDRIKEERKEGKRNEVDLFELNKAINMATNNTYDLHYDQVHKKYTLKPVGETEPVQKS